MARTQRLLEATGTLNANNGNEMGYQLTEQGKARALDALAQSEYYGAMPVPLEVYREQVKRQSVRNMQITRAPAHRRHGPSDPARHADRPAWPRRLRRPLDPDVRTARQRQILDLQRHPRRPRRPGLRAPRHRIRRPGHHRLRPDRAFRRRGSRRRPELAAPRHALRHALCLLRTAHGDHRGRIVALHARSRLQPDRAHLSGAAATEIHRRHLHRRRPWPPGGTAAKPRQPLDRAAGGKQGHPRPAIG